MSREAAAAGDLYALGELARWLRGRPGREAEAEVAFREAAHAGDPHALRELTRWLEDRPGRAADAEQA